MAWRVAAAWALIGFAAQCLLACLEAREVSTALSQALVHYAAWGCAGLLIGVIVERAVEDSFDNFARRREQEPQVDTPPPPLEPPIDSDSH